MTKMQAFKVIRFIGIVALLMSVIIHILTFFNFNMSDGLSNVMFIGFLY